ncbi:unnamed protein product, partial [Phaeothamnion confervicola]
SLCRPYAGARTSQSRLDAARTMFRLSVNRSRHMLDLVYIAIGLGCFGLLAGYAALCGRL